MILHVWYELGNVLVIGRGYDTALTKIAFALACFAGENMAGKCTASLDLAGAGFFETLCCAAVSLDFRHF